MTSRLVFLMSLLLLASCSNNQLMQTPASVSTTGVQQINQALDESITRNDSAKAPDIPLPPGVTAALLPPISESGAKPVIEPRFDLAVAEVPARDFFSGLVSGSQYNVVVHPGVTDKISLELKNVTVPEVMTLVRDLYNMDIQVSGKLYKVSARQLRTQVFQINYLNIKRSGGSETRVSSGQITGGGAADATGNTNAGSSGSSSSPGAAPSTQVGTRISTTSEADFWSHLNETLGMLIGAGEGRSVVSTPNAGIIVVRAMPEELLSVEDYLRRAELIMQRQVILEAKILEVELSDNYKQGVDWTALESGASIDANGLPKKLIGLDMSGKEIVDEITGGVFSATVKVGDFSSFIHLLGQQGNVQVLSSPRISTVNNQKAVIKVGNDEYFVTDIAISDNNDTSNTSTDVTITPFFSGIALDVTPQIGDDGKITLHVHPTISQVQDQQKIISVGTRDLNLPLAFSSIRETDSIISANDGQIVVIGGLIQTIIRDVNTSVPVLGDIPLVGELFKQKNQKSVKSELVILLRPYVTGKEVYQRDLRESRQRFGHYEALLSSPNQSE
ncbi:MAG: pilus (MSHA type) biogenesis protein MshL [Hahellaceae bacterium]|nr:pilus (MSHA type) biogenesis protein MshL [Hahellaceae bacterium]MCP5168579.1 pilus (MSHA type) biogenesis protein MshL [Hahellaceae bacterium]